jgi:hypothetical protein
VFIMRRVLFVSIICAAVLISGMGPAAKVASAQDGTVMWINHLDFLAGDPSLISTSFNAVDSGVGDGLSGLIIESSTTGEDAGKVVEKGLIVPPGYLISGVRVCYEVSEDAYITSIQLVQVQDPPSSATLVLDDPTDQPNTDPVCVDTDPDALLTEPIDPAVGGLRLSLGINSGGEVDDLIVLRAVGLHLVLDPNSLMLQAVEALLEDLDIELREVIADAVENHSHLYLTGRGVGHNKVTAESGPGMPSEDEILPPEPKKRNKKNK